MRKIGLKHSSNNANTVKKYIAELELDTSHWKDQIIKKHRSGYERNINDVFIENSTYTKSHLRDKIIKHKLMDYKCVCGLEGTWNCKPLVLQVDHVNGNNTDHRIDNLRFLCPNCHSQTINYGGANALNRKKAETFTCKNCSKYRSRVSKSGLCNNCFSKQDKINWEDDATLVKMVENIGLNQTAKKLNVSYPGLKKRMIKRNLL